MRISKFEKIGLILLSLNGCIDSDIGNKDVNSTCELVHDVVLSIYADPLGLNTKINEKADSKAIAEQRKCEALGVVEQEHMLRSKIWILTGSKISR